MCFVLKLAQRVQSSSWGLSEIGLSVIGFVFGGSPFRAGTVARVNCVSSLGMSISGNRRRWRGCAMNGLA